MDKKYFETIQKVTKQMNELELKKDRFIAGEKLCETLLNEAYGSFPGQYKSVKELVNSLINKKNSGEFIDNGNEVKITTSGEVVGVGKVNVISYWSTTKANENDMVKGESIVKNNIQTIILHIKTANIPFYELPTTIAHEIMHCFQQKLPKNNGVNEKTMILYHYIPMFLTKNYTDFCYYFFYGMYITYSFEMSANISSVSSFIGEYFKNRNKNEITTMEYVDALKKCDKYNAYESVLNLLPKIKITKTDIDYIKKCMTGTFKNMFGNGEDIVLYNSETFNTEAFICKAKQDIIKKCQETIEKMYGKIRKST